MASIVLLTSDYNRQYLVELHRWFTLQWGKVDPLESPLGLYPQPIVALDAKLQLVAGLAFTTAASPLEQADAVWINALYVAPDHRRQGIAGELVQAAASVAAGCGHKALYVYTHVPALYTQQQWSSVAAEGEHCVLVKQLN